MVRRDKRSSAWKRRSSKQENHNRVARASLPSFRAVGVCISVTVLACMPVFPIVMPYVPRYFVACFFTWLACVFFRESIWEVFFESPCRWSDTTVVALMMIAMPFVGFLEGILLGLVLSCVTVSFSQTLTTTVIRLQCDGRAIQSNTSRLPEHAGFLRRYGDAIQVMHLQGNIGFGTCRQITEIIEDLVGQGAGGRGGGRQGQLLHEEESAVGKFVVVAKSAQVGLYIICDMRDVTSLDYSAAQQLRRLTHCLGSSAQGKSRGASCYLLYTRAR